MLRDLEKGPGMLVRNPIKKFSDLSQLWVREVFLTNQETEVITKDQTDNFD